MALPSGDLAEGEAERFPFFLEKERGPCYRAR